MFNRRAISSTEMRLLGESANPSALACALPAMASPDVIHVNPRRARHRTCDRPRPGPIAAFPHNSADLDLRPKTRDLVGAHAVRLGFCQVQQLKGVREIFARLKSPARYPFAPAQHEPGSEPQSTSSHAPQEALSALAPSSGTTSDPEFVPRFCVAAESAMDYQRMLPARC